MLKEENKTSDGLRVYEVGYLLVSSLPEEKVSGEEAKIKDLLSKHKAEIIASESPKKHALAYEMIKKVGTQNIRFNEGYFGWVKFEVSQTEVKEIKSVLDTDAHILRNLLITTVKENTYLGEGAKELAKDISKAEDDEEVKEDVKSEIPVGTASVEEIDKSIDDMVTKSA